MQLDLLKNIYSNCSLCPRACKVDRYNDRLGYCTSKNTLKVARAALHYWEEPCISGTKGSGTVFFTGCSLKCVYCQNKDIAIGRTGRDITIDRLVEIFFELKEKGANNINLVTASHYIPSVTKALLIAKNNGLDIPIVYNTSGYELVDSLKMLDGLVDIYLPDLKYYGNDIAKLYSNADDYFSVVKEAIGEMYRQVGRPEFTFNSENEEMIAKGVIVRHLVLPGHVEDSKNIIKYLYDTYRDDIYISIMNQYTPGNNIDACKYPNLTRKLSVEEYDEVVNYAIDIGIENGFIQEGDTAEESFIPNFDMEGV